MAGLIDEIGIVDILNQRLGIDAREKVSTGVIVKAMLLNGLGFVSAPLYLFGQFFQGKATEHLKDPLFFADSVFLKSPNRIAALGMIMALCLLVYNLGQRQLRQALVQHEQTISNQLGKPTAVPTLRWVFQCFMAVHLVVIQGVEQVVNLTNERVHILRFFSDAIRRYYLLPAPDS